MTALQYVAVGLLLGMAWEFLPELVSKLGTARAPAHFSGTGSGAIAGALQVHQLLQLFPDSDPLKDQRRMDTNDRAFAAAARGDDEALRYLGARGGKLGTVLLDRIPDVTEGGAVSSWASRRARAHAAAMYEVLRAAPRQDELTYQTYRQ